MYSTYSVINVNLNYHKEQSCHESCLPTRQNNDNISMQDEDLFHMHLSTACHCQDSQGSEVNVMKNISIDEMKTLAYTLERIFLMLEYLKK